MAASPHTIAEYADQLEIPEHELIKIVQTGATDPCYWAEKVLGRVFWERQREIVLAVRDNRKTAVAACHASGKSDAAAVLLVWFMNNFAPARAMTTAPTERQVKRILWSSIGDFYKKAKIPLAGSCLQLALEIDEASYALGFASRDYDINVVQGLHSDNILCIVDEACGVAGGVYEGIYGIMGGGNAKLLEIGNPVDPNTTFAENMNDPDVASFNISAYDTPNFNIPGHELREEYFADGSWRERLGPYLDNLPFPMLCTPEYVEDIYKKFGPGSPQYVGRVLGRFPDQSEDSLIARTEVEDAMKCVTPLKDYENEPIILGVDVARFGKDRTVIVGRQGKILRVLADFQKTDTKVTTDKIEHLYKRMGQMGSFPVEIRVDVIGLGAGVVDQCFHRGLPVVAFNSSQQEDIPEGYLNMRAYAYWELHELLQGRNLDLDHDPMLKKELLQIRWKTADGSDKIQIMGKEWMRSQGYDSPNRADAAMIACAPGVRARNDYGITV